MRCVLSLLSTSGYSPAVCYSSWPPARSPAETLSSKRFRRLSSRPLYTFFPRSFSSLDRLFLYRDDAALCPPFSVVSAADTRAWCLRVVFFVGFPSPSGVSRARMFDRKFKNAMGTYRPRRAVDTCLSSPGLPHPTVRPLLCQPLNYFFSACVRASRATSPYSLAERRKYPNPIAPSAAGVGGAVLTSNLYPFHAIRSRSISPASSAASDLFFHLFVFFIVFWFLFFVLLLFFIFTLDGARRGERERCRAGMGMRAVRGAPRDSRYDVTAPPPPPPPSPTSPPNTGFDDRNVDCNSDESMFSALHRAGTALFRLYEFIDFDGSSS